MNSNISLIAVFVIISAFTNGYEYEGCKSSEGGSGVCIVISKCPSAVKQLQARRRHTKTRCGFQGTMEVVCCTDESVLGLLVPDTDDSPSWDAETQTPTSTASILDKGAVKDPRRKSQIACQEYMKEVTAKVGFNIIGGEKADPGDFPHMAALGYETEDEDVLDWRCGGSLISNRYVLTAAHCIFNIDGRKPVRVRLGVVDITSADAVDVEVENIKMHPGYNRRNRTNDIALVRLARDVTFSENLLPGCLYSKGDDPTGLVVSGWGATTKEMTSRSNLLLKASVEPVAIATCNNTYVEKKYKPLTAMQLCAWSRDGSRDSCSGDSGGPIQVLLPENIYAIVGVISYGLGCGGSTPAVYARVYSYLDWIEPIVWP